MNATSRSLIAASLAITLTAISGVEASAYNPDDFPTWSEVEAARKDSSAKAQEIKRLSSLIDGLEAEATATAAEAERLFRVYDDAQTAADEANQKLDALNLEVAAATEKAELSTAVLASIAVRMSRNSGVDLTLQLLLDGSNASDLLSNLSTAAAVTKLLAQLQTTAVEERNQADALKQQAKVVADERIRLAKAATEAFDAASSAAQESSDALEIQKQNEDVLRAQLVVLQENREATEADYKKGQKERNRQPPVAAADDGQLSDQGWALPAAGTISEPFGRRKVYVPGAGLFHYATDLRSGCGGVVRAATAGKVKFAGAFGSYGNWILIDHGDGVQTGYAHNATLLVAPGEDVRAGQPIAAAGQTGIATGCHSHFEVRLGNVRIDPQPFMSVRGITLG